MNVTLTEEQLVQFEEDICKLFAEKKIHAPVHLDNGNEKPLIEIFKRFVDEEDWCFGSWRQHYKSLLKGVPPDSLKIAIQEGKSISLCFPEQRVISSAIVGGILPIAVGTAMGIKRQGGTNKVVCFLGEMTSETGIFHECLKYSLNQQLPILFVLEDNEKSVCTPTLPVWNMSRLTYQPAVGALETCVYLAMDPAAPTKPLASVWRINEKLLYYKYSSRFPHAGTGARINF